MIKIFYDTETTGLDYKKHCIHQLAGYVEIDDIIVETFDIRMAPHPKAQIDPQSLKIAGITYDDFMLYQSFAEGYREFKRVLNRYIQRYEPKDRAILIGFNNIRFDDDFLRMMFDLNGDTFFYSYFWSGFIDTMVLASQYLINRRAEMPSFKLKRVALELGIVYDKSELHGALFDAMLTRKIYRIVTGLDLEI